MALMSGEVKSGFLADDPANATLVPLPPQNGGAVGWGQVYVSFAAEFADAVLRVAVWNDTARAFRIMERLAVPRAGGRVNISIQDGDSKISVGRVKAGPSDTGRCPVAWLLETTLKG
ncbi:hypothetical protein ACFV1L_18350 [Kitasatospora sp. NPDC059646]|uniref:hypothetical protein n=1 Tax=Kitasatospora sp. NPDC059646 TaxID=3346893 RepID=UPI0036CAA5A8